MFEHPVIKVCANCRAPLVGKQQKYCARCAPYMKRMNDKARFSTKKWKPVSKHCPVCDKIKLISQFSLRVKTKGGWSMIRHICDACRSRRTVEIDAPRRRMRNAGLPHTLTGPELHDTWLYFDNKCAYCGEDKLCLHSDHFIPVTKGGGYTKDNIVPACWHCNSSKSNKYPLDWLIMREGGLVKYAEISSYLGQYA